MADATAAAAAEPSTATESVEMDTSSNEGPAFLDDQPTADDEYGPVIRDATGGVVEDLKKDARDWIMNLNQTTSQVLEETPRRVEEMIEKSTPQ